MFAIRLLVAAVAAPILLASVPAAAERPSPEANPSSLAAPSVDAPEGEARHLTLRRSSPSDGTSVASPPEIRLWFSQEPQRGSTTLTLTGPGGTLSLGDVTVDPEDPKVFFARVQTPLAAGSYRVNWRTMASDGHVIRGEFAFAVTAE